MDEIKKALLLNILNKMIKYSDPILLEDFNKVIKCQDELVKLEKIYS
jgi:hypothetical protein